MPTRVVKLLEDDVGTDLRAPGFPAALRPRGISMLQGIHIAEPVPIGAFLDRPES